MTPNINEMQVLVTPEELVYNPVNIVHHVNSKLKVWSS